MRRLNSGSCPTSLKFIDVPGVPPRRPIVTPSLCAIPTFAFAIALREAAAAGAAASSAREASKERERERRLIVSYLLVRDRSQAIPGLSRIEAGISRRADPEGRPDSPTAGRAGLPLTQDHCRHADSHGERGGGRCGQRSHARLRAASR